MSELADSIRSEAAQASRPGQMGRLEAIADEVAAAEQRAERVTAAVEAVLDHWERTDPAPALVRGFSAQIRAALAAPNQAITSGRSEEDA